MKLLSRKFTCNRSEDTCSTWALIVTDNNTCIFIKIDVRTVFTANTAFRTNNNSFNNVTFFNNATWCCFFTVQTITSPMLAVLRPEPPSTLIVKNFTSTRVVSNFQTSFLLNHLCNLPSEFDIFRTLIR